MAAVDDIFEACYDQLRRIAHKHLAVERPDHSLQTTELVHEAYVRLADGVHLEVKSRAHFFAVAARAMRRVLVDYARRRRSVKRGGLMLRVPLAAAASASAPPISVDFIALDRALTVLESEMPLKARVVELRYFGGMTHAEIGEVLDLPLRTVKRYAAYAQARLYEMLRDTGDAKNPP